MITIVGSLVMDVAIAVPRLVEPGGVVHGDGLRVSVGGKGANQAVAAARMGGTAALVGVVGADLFGDAMLSELRDAGVDTRAVIRRQTATSGCFVVAADPHGQTEIVVANGANGTLTAADVERNAGLICKSQALVVQLETTLDAVAAALRIARQAQVLTLFNAAPAFHFQPELLALCNFLVVNEREAATVVGLAVNDRAAAAHAAAAMRQLGATNVLVTLGAAGVWADLQAWRGHIPGHIMPVVDTLGAGDTFVGALAALLCEGMSPQSALEFAIAASAISVTRMGAQSSIPSREEVQRFMNAAGCQHDAWI